MNKMTITARMHKDGTVVELLPDGSQRPFPEQPMKRKAEGEALAASLADCDAVPMTEAQISNARRIPRVKTMRRAMQLTQEEFSSRYHIPIGTLRDWEQGRSEPDQTARAYLMAIAAAPEAVKEALQCSPH
jgi:putative transcriptional regulator